MGQLIHCEVQFYWKERFFGHLRRYHYYDKQEALRVCGGGMIDIGDILGVGCGDGECFTLLPEGTRITIEIPMDSKELKIRGDADILWCKENPEKPPE